MAAQRADAKLSTRRQWPGPIETEVHRVLARENLKAQKGLLSYRHQGTVKGRDLSGPDMPDDHGMVLLPDRDQSPAGENQSGHASQRVAV